MRVYITHGQSDWASARELSTFLKSRGMVVETESNGRFSHLQSSDVVVALWSQKAVFDSGRMQFERRMLDAWADGQLVLVKLDHVVLPVGLRDLPAIDASISSGRDLAVWPQVERAAKKAMNDALVVADERSEDRSAAPPAPRTEISRSAAHDQSSAGGGAGPPLGFRYENPTEILRPGMSAPPTGGMRKPGGAPEASERRDSRGLPPLSKEQIDQLSKRKSSAFPLWALGFVLAGLGLGAAGWRLAQAGWDFQNITPSTASMLGVAGIAVVVLLAAAARAMFGTKPKAATSAPMTPAAAAPAPAARAPASFPAAEPAPQPAAPTPAALFISYAHADNAQVEPVIAVVTATGRTVWIDKTGIEAGEGWAGEIVRAIKGARGIIVMCSKHAFESDHVKREVYLADRYKKPMRPVFLEAAQPPEDFEYFFASVQWLELWKLPEADRAAAIGKALEAV